MPRLIDLGSPHGVVSFPDDATDEQIVSDYRALQSKAQQQPESPSASDYARQVGGSLIRGLGRTIAGIPEGLAIAREAIPAMIPQPLRGAVDAATTALNPADLVSRISGGRIPDTTEMLQMGANGIKGATEAISPAPVPELEESFLASKLPSGVGSALGFIGGGLAGQALKIPRWLSIAGLGSAVGGSEFYEDAKRSGADEETAQIASLIGNVVGTTEALPLSRIIGRLNRVSGGTFGRALIETGRDTLEEALQEGASQLAQNVTAQQLYDSDRELYRSVAEGSGVGGATGFLLSAAAQALGIPIGRSRMRRQSATESEERIKRVIQEREKQYAEGTRTITPTPGEEAAAGEEAAGGVRVRDIAQDRLETETGAPIIQPQPSTQIGGETVERTQEERQKEGVLTPTPSEVAVQNVIADVTRGWQNAPPIRVVATSEQFPDQVKSDARVAGFQLNEIPAAKTADGTVWMAANLISDEEHARRLLLHEAVGHFGVETIFGTPEQFTQFMQGVAQRHAATELGRQTRELYGGDAVTVGKEVVAKLAENPTIDPTLWQTIVATVRDWARRVFKLEVTDNDIKVLLSRGRKAVEQGKPAGVPAQATSFAQAPQQDAPVVYKGFQPGFGTIPGTDLYNLTDTIAENLVKGSTVTESSLNKAGYRVPQAEKVKADAGRPAGTSFAVERLGQIPDWVSPAFRSKLEQMDKAGAGFKIDINEEWKSFSPSQRQELAAYGWSVDEGRDRHVRIGLHTDVGPNRLRKKVTGTSFSREQEVFKRAQREVREEISPSTGEIRGYSVRGFPGIFGSREDAVAKAIVQELRADKIAKPLNQYLDELIRRQPSERGMEFQTEDVPRAEFYDDNGNRITGTAFAVERPPPPQQFGTRQQVEQAVATPGLSPQQQLAARTSAAVQSTMSPDSIVGWLIGQDTSKADTMAKGWLEYIEDRRYISDLQQRFSTLPTTTEEQRRERESIADQLLGHHSADKTVEAERVQDMEKAAGEMVKLAPKMGKAFTENLKANFLTAMFNRLATDLRTYHSNLLANAPAAGNLQAQYRQRLNTAQERLNDQEQSPTALRRALEAMAQNLPANLLTPNSSNQAIVSWLLLNDTLQGVVGSDVRTWLLADDGSGVPALQNYTRLIDDINNLREVLTNQQQVANDISAFEQGFRPSGTEGKISDKQALERYFKLRTGRDKALAVARGIEKKFDDLDTGMRANVIALDRLRGMMTTPDYVETVRQAADAANVVVRAIFNSPWSRSGNGIIDRDENNGRWKLRGPTGTEYVVDLYPSSTMEKENRIALSSFVAEAEQYQLDHSVDDPLVADEYGRYADYIEKHLLNPAFDPSEGFMQTPWMQIPGTTIRFSQDPFDAATSMSGFLGFSWHTLRDTVERIGGRAVKQAVQDGFELDTVMKKVDGINHHPEYGYAATTRAVLKALDSHGWPTSMLSNWDEMVAEPVIAAGQNNLSPHYGVGDEIVGSGVTLNSEDVAALKLMKRWQDAVVAAAPKNIRDRIGQLGILRKAIGSGPMTMARLPAIWTRNFVNDWNGTKNDAERIALLVKGHNFRRVVMGYMGEFNPELDKMNNASPAKSKLFDIYRRLALTEKQRVSRFSSLDDVLDYVAQEIVSRNISPDYATARQKAQETLLSEIRAMLKSFENNVLNFKDDEVWGDVPAPVVDVASANNAFTMPRGRLHAPSTFYSYSMSAEGARANYVGGLRRLMNLKVIQSGMEAQRAM